MGLKLFSINVRAAFVFSFYLAQEEILRRNQFIALGVSRKFSPVSLAVWIIRLNQSDPENEPILVRIIKEKRKMELAHKKGLAAVAVAAALTLGSTIPASAVTLDSSVTGDGFISRGNVISHPELGKSALVMDPVVSLSVGGATFQQTCMDTVDPAVTNTFTQEIADTDLMVTTRTAKGNGNITGYLLGAELPLYVAPTTLCPTDWVPVEGDAGLVTFVVGTTPMVITFTAGELTGSWVWNTTTLTWDVVMD